MKKRLLSIILTVCMVLTLLPTTTLAASTAWNGTADTSWYNVDQNSFILTTGEQLAGLAVLVNGGNTFGGKTIQLGADIDLGGTINWTPIGKLNLLHEFRGTFDGGGKTISNMKILAEVGAADAFGLFGRNLGVVRNVALKSVSIDVTNNAAESGVSVFIGAISGSNSTTGTVQNCYVDNNSTIKGTNTNQGSVSVGGLIGINHSGALIYNSYSAANVTSSGSGSTTFVGGVLGRLLTGFDAGYISHCYWYDADVNGIGDRTDVSNISAVSGTDTLSTLVNIGGIDYSSLLGALNAWVNNRNFRTWTASSGSYPVLSTLWVPPTYTATVTVQKDGSLWSGSGKSLALYQSGTKKYELTLSGSTAACSALVGTYDVYDGTTDTNVDISVSSGGGNAATVNYYSFTLGAGIGTSSPTGSGVYLAGKSVAIDVTVNTGYVWSKWTSGNTAVLSDQTTKSTSITMPTGSINLTAQATPIQNNITYTLNGGTVSTANPASYTVESAIITLNTPTRSGYSFVGWTGSNGTTEQTNVSIPTGSTGNKTYTANWKADKPASAPAASIVTARTHTSLTITTQGGYEYSVDGTNWYSGTGSYTFTDLSSGTVYNLVCRKAAVTTGNTSAASDASEALSVSTKTAPATAPATPTIGTGTDKPTSNSITISTAAGNEYYISTSATADWSGTPNGYFKATINGTHKFDSLSPATQYYIHVRVAETGSAMPSSSASVAQYTLPVTPTVSAVTINYAAETISFANTYEVSASADFTTTITSGGTITPGTTYYVRVKSASGVPASEVVSFTVAARPTPAAILAANITRTDTVITISNTISTQEYSVDGTNWQTGTGGNLSFNSLTPNKPYSVVTRIPSSAASFVSAPSSALSVTTKTAPAALSDNSVTYSVKNGTITGLGSTYEYSLNNGATWQTTPVTGVTFTAGNVIKVRTRETDDAMPSLPQTLGTIGTLVEAPSYVIDFINEKTTISVPATVEYNMTSATAATWTAGPGVTLTLTPGTTYYFRVAATEAALASNVQTLVIPARPAAPDVSVVTIAAGADASHTAITLADIYEYILADALPDFSMSGTVGTGSATEIAATGGQHVYIRVKASNTSFTSAWTDCGEVQLGVDNINLTGVGYDVAADTLTGTTTNIQYSLDNGASWQDCTADNTTGLTFVAGTVKVRQKDKPTNEHIVGTIAPVESSTDPTLGSKTYNSVTLTTMPGYEYSKDGGATWQDSNVFSGLNGSTEYSFVGRIKATAMTLPGTVSAALTVTTDSAPSGSLGNSSASTGAPVTVDGKTENIGTEYKTGDATTVTVDQSKLGENINGAAAGSSVVVPVSENSAATASLVVKNIEDMAQKGMTLTVQTGSVAYNLNTSAIDTAALTAAFPGTDMSEVPFDVTIQNSSVSVEGETLVLNPVAFTITATYNGKTVSVDTFSVYIDRMIEVTPKQAARITTAVVVNVDGSTRHVPTNVVEKDGKYYAIINSRTNSTYALIQNEVTFADAKGKWYEGMVNEMGSRKIIAGHSASVFGGGASITRAEFATILVRALGLPTDGTSSFSDVPTTAWYTGAVATAVQYGLTGGTGENHFSPNAAITRQEAMLMLKRAAALTEFIGTSGALDGFSDADAVSSWAKGAAKWNVGSGLIQGSDGKLNPTAKITRAESATIILRLLQKAGLVDVRS